MPRKKPVIPLAAVLALAALAAALACSRRPPPPTPPPTLLTPSKVITTEGMEFFVWSLRFAGTNQELALRQGGAQVWVPLAIVRILRFSGPEQDRYRSAEIVLTSGEKLRGEVFVGHSLQGTSDVGYWNLPLSKVSQLGMGSE